MVFRGCTAPDWKFDRLQKVQAAILTNFANDPVHYGPMQFCSMHVALTNRY